MRDRLATTLVAPAREVIPSSSACRRISSAPSRPIASIDRPRRRRRRRSQRARGAAPHSGLCSPAGRTSSSTTRSTRKATPDLFPPAHRTRPAGGAERAVGGRSSRRSGTNEASAITPTPITLAKRIEQAENRPESGASDLQDARRRNASLARSASFASCSADGPSGRTLSLSR